MSVRVGLVSGLAAWRLGLWRLRRSKMSDVVTQIAPPVDVYLVTVHTQMSSIKMFTKIHFSSDRNVKL